MAQKHLWHTIWWALACAATILALPSLGGAQWESHAALTASTSVRLVAFKRSSITVSVREVPLAFDFEPDFAQPPLTIPVITTWNVNPLEVRGVEVVAYFVDSERALLSSELVAVPARYVVGSVDRGPYRAFAESHQIGPMESSLRLMDELISSGNTRATRNQLLQIRMDEAHLHQWPADLYSGVLQIEARYY